MNADAETEFREFVAARSPALLRSAYLLVGGDWALAEDLLQAALIKTYLAWGRIRDPGARERYVRTTLATTATSWWRRRWHGERATAVLPETANRDRVTRSTTGTRSGLWSAACPPGNARSSCCASTRTSARPKRPGRLVFRSAR